MAVTLRLARHGQKKRPFYRIVAAEREAPRDGRFLEIVGTYNTMVSPPAVRLKEDRVRRWVEVGAGHSLVVGTIIKKQIPGLLEGREESRRTRIQAARRKRKERAAARAS